MRDAGRPALPLRAFFAINAAMTNAPHIASSRQTASAAMVARALSSLLLLGLSGDRRVR
jgi:hypothetical protein